MLSNESPTKYVVLAFVTLAVIPVTAGSATLISNSAVKPSYVTVTVCAPAADISYPLNTADDVTSAVAVLL